MFGLRPRPARVATAWLTSWPTTFGTFTCATPVDTVRVTVDPLATFEPPPGFSSETWPFGTVSFDAVTTRGTRPCSLIFATASGRASSVTSGTAIGLFELIWSWIFV